ncbi:AI-2E family transporter [Candidatus Falkowbacteria bacterium]|nr:MAG: AI-2E family transporter [Candidatus Falkowbacteria bacterium]
MPEQSMRFTLTTSSLIRIIVVLLLLYFAYLISDILVLLFTSIILTSAIDPWVDWMQKKGIPRALGIFIIYAILLGAVGVSVYLIIPPIITQFGQLVQDIPARLDQLNTYIASFNSYTSGSSWFDNLKSSFSNSATAIPQATSSIFSTVFNFFGGLFSSIIILVISFYLLAEENSIRKLVWSVTPEKKQKYVMDVLTRMQKRIGLWMRGQLILCVSIFALTYLGLSILGVKYALILAIIAGFTEFIPYLGPILGAIPAVFLASGQSMTIALFTIILYVIIQQIENNFLVPKIMQKTAGLNPIISIVVLMIGFSIGGILGALLSIPVATAGMVIVEDMLNKKYTLSGKSSEE